jgi:hypothetical protein
MDCLYGPILHPVWVWPKAARCDLLQSGWAIEGFTVNQVMTDDQANRVLRPAVILWSVAGLLGIPLAVYFDLLGGWRWPPYNAIYDQMIVSVYFALGVCAARAIKNPIRHASFLWFVAISSFTHGAVMLFHALHNPMHLGHLVGDVWILAGGISLAWPLWRSRRAADRP